MLELYTEDNDRDEEDSGWVLDKRKGIIMKYRTDFVTNSSSSGFIAGWLGSGRPGLWGDGIAKAAKERYGERCPSILKYLLDNSVPPELANWILEETKGVAHNYEGKFEDATPESDECFIPCDCDLLSNVSKGLEKLSFTSSHAFLHEGIEINFSFSDLLGHEKPLESFLDKMRERDLNAPASSGDVVKNAFDLTVELGWLEDEDMYCDEFLQEDLKELLKDAFGLLVYAMYAKELFGEESDIRINIWEETWGIELDIGTFYDCIYDDITDRDIAAPEIDNLRKYFKMDKNDNLLQELCDMRKGDITEDHTKRMQEFLDHKINGDLQRYFNDKTSGDADAFFTILELQIKRDKDDWRIVHD